MRRESAIPQRRGETRRHTQGMRYWWASQGKNYEHVAHTGNLWTCPRENARPLRSRQFIFDLSPDDLVFHYGNKALRAVSKVTASYVDWPRPEHYPREDGEGDEGWLVRTEPLITGLHIPLQKLQQVVAHGTKHHPLDRDGWPNQIFLAKLWPSDAVAMLQLAGITVDAQHDGAERASNPIWQGESTSVIREVLARREQAALRDHLLAGAEQGTCDLCGRELPAALLVAAHIVPRSQLTDKERRDFETIAMLACTLGCDALFEHGYIAVDASGVVRDLVDPNRSDLSIAAQRIASRHCSAHTPSTSHRFAKHLELSEKRRRDH